jgi:hypothetical protein
MARWANRSPDTQFLIAVGTFVNAPHLRRWRDLGVEGIPEHFAALRRATEPALHRNVVAGSAIYCEWHTDDADWRALGEFLRPSW